jgi:hypothetical protein
MRTSLSKQNLLTLLAEVERVLEAAIPTAEAAAKAYSEDPASRYAFEVGHLSGSVKSALDLVNQKHKFIK